MKYSRYNSIITISKNHHLLYNAISDNFIFLTDITYQDYKNNNANELYEHNVFLHNQLVEIKGIIEESIDEIKTVTDLIKKTDNDNTSYYLYINPTLDCIFNCWYCYESHLKGSKMSPKIIKSVNKLITNIIREQQDLQFFTISFFGGEPLMYFNTVAKPIIKHLEQEIASSKVKVHIHFTTNGYLLNSRLINYLKGKSISFQITLDGAKEDHDKTRFTKNGIGSYKRIINNIKELAKSGINVILRINYTTSNILSIHETQHDLKDLEFQYRNNINIDLQKIWQDQDANTDITTNAAISKYVELFQSEGYNVSSHKILHSVIDSCYGDKRNQALINYNGDVFKCTARDFLTENRLGYLNQNGIIIWEKNSLERRMTSKFNRPICHNCRIAPLCGGGCSQQAMENLFANECLYHYTKQDIDNIILNRFEFLVVNRYKK